MSLLDQAIEVPSGGSLLDQAIDVEDSSFAAEMAEQKRRNKESLRQHKIAEFQDLPFYQRLPAVAAVGAMKGGFDVLSLGNRIASAVGPAGMGQFSDDVNAAMAESPLAGGRFVDESIEGATRSLSKAIPIGMAGGGRYGIIAEAGLTAANQAYTKARRAGKSQAAALAYATTSGVIEAGITTLLPGQEALIAKNKGLVGGVTQWVKRTLMGIGGELPQEAAIAYAQGAADVGFGVDPSALSAESRGRAARSVIGQTLAGGAGIAGVQALTPPAHGAIAEQARVDRAQPDIEARRSQFVTPENVRYVLNSLRETGQSDGLEALATKPQPTRKDWDSAGLPPDMGKSGDTRAQFAARLKEEIEANPKPIPLPADDEPLFSLGPKEQPPDTSTVRAENERLRRMNRTPLRQIQLWLEHNEPSNPLWPEFEQMFREEMAKAAGSTEVSAQRPSEVPDESMASVDIALEQEAKRRAGQRTLANLGPMFQDAAGPLEQAVSRQQVPPAVQQQQQIEQPDYIDLAMGLGEDRERMKRLGLETPLIPRDVPQSVAQESLPPMAQLSEMLDQGRVVLESPDGKRYVATSISGGRIKTAGGTMLNGIGNGWTMRLQDQPKTAAQVEQAVSVAKEKRKKKKEQASAQPVPVPPVAPETKAAPAARQAPAPTTVAQPEAQAAPRTLASLTIAQLEQQAASLDQWLADADLTDPQYDSNDIQSQLVNAELRKRKTNAGNVRENAGQVPQVGLVQEGGAGQGRENLQQPTPGQPGGPEAQASLTESPNSIRLTPMAVAPGGKSMLSGIGKHLRKWWHWGGLLPVSVRAANERRVGRIRKEMQVMAFAATKLRDEIIKHGASNKTSAAGEKLINDALHGDTASMQLLPAGVRGAVQEMRSHIDRLSPELIDIGLAEGDLAVTIDRNNGVYVHRSYQVHDDTKWHEKVEPAVVAAAKEHIRHSFLIPSDLDSKTYSELVHEAARRGLIPKSTDSKRIDLTGMDRGTLTDLLEHYTLPEQQVNNMVEDLLHAERAPAALVKLSKLGSKDLSITKARQNIPAPIRALMGEHTDTLVNYTKSITKIANLIANHHFLQEVKANGMGQFLFEKDSPTRPPGHYEELAAPNSSVMKPLNGLMTTPEVKEAFDEYNTRVDLPGYSGGILRAWSMAVLAAKMSKTILNIPAGHLRNVVGSFTNALQNGHWDVRYLWPAGRTAYEGIRLAAPDSIRRFLPTYDEYHKRLVKYHEMNIGGTSVEAGMAREVLNDVIIGAPSSVTNNPLIQVAKGGVSIASIGWQAGDNWFKFSGIEQDLDAYRKAYKKAGRPFNEEQQAQDAANRINDIYWNFDRVPPAIKSMRRVPVIGDFAAFASEYIRAQFNTLAVAAKELQDPALRTIGAKRVVGTIATMSLPFVIEAALKSLWNLSDDDDEALRRHIAPWSRNSQLAWLDVSDKTNPTFIDMSWMFPSTYLYKPYRAMLNGDDWEESFWGAAKELADPFLGEGILTEKVLDVTRNTTSQGSSVYNPAEGTLTQSAQKIGHVAKAFEPPPISRIQKIRKAVAGEKGTKGQDYDVKTELAGLMGLGTQKTDIRQSLGFSARGYKNMQPDATRIFSEVFGSQGAVSPDQVKSAYRGMETARRANFDELQQDVSAARRLGVGEDDLLKTLVVNGVPEEEAKQVMRNDYQPYTLSNAMHSKVKDFPYATDRTAAFWQAWTEAGGIEHVLARYDSETDPFNKKLIGKRIHEYVLDSANIPGNPMLNQDASTLHPLVLKELRAVIADKRKLPYRPQRKRAGDRTYQDTLKNWKAEVEQDKAWIQRNQGLIQEMRTSP